MIHQVEMGPGYHFHPPKRIPLLLRKKKLKPYLLLRGGNRGICYPRLSPLVILWAINGGGKKKPGPGKISCRGKRRRCRSWPRTQFRQAGAQKRMPIYAEKKKKPAYLLKLGEGQDDRIIAIYLIKKGYAGFISGGKIRRSSGKKKEGIQGVSNGEECRSSSGHIPLLLPAGKEFSRGSKKNRQNVARNLSPWDKERRYKFCRKGERRKKGGAGVPS